MRMEEYSLKQRLSTGVLPLILYFYVAMTAGIEADPPLLQQHLSVSEEVTVFTRGEGGYYCIKIPSLLTTANGTLLAFGEGRMFSCSDFTWTDLIYKRSHDGGKTWGPLQLLYSNSSMDSGVSTVIGNAAPVVLHDSRRILVPFCRNNLQVMLTYSDDDGLTWSKPINLTGVTHPTWKWVGTGPPGSIQLDSKRIIVPAYHTVTPNVDGGLSEVHMMISDDGGKSWYIGGNVTDWNLQYPNENQAVSFGGSNVFVNARTMLTDRIGALSKDGGLTFGPHFVLKGLPQPLGGCQGSTIRHPVTGILFYSGPATVSPFRHNMSIYTSLDNGLTWNAKAVIHSGSSSYSSLAVLGDGHSIGLLYEWANKTKLIFDPDYFSFVAI